MKITQIHSSAFNILCFYLFCGVLLAPLRAGAQWDRDSIGEAARMAGIQFNNDEKALIGDGLKVYLHYYRELQQYTLPNQVPPALWFNPVLPGMVLKTDKPSDKISQRAARVRLPVHRDELAFYTIRELSELIRSRQISSSELMRFFIDRLKKFDPMLHCVISYTEETAMKQARKADAEIARGHYRGPLHGIPYGVKDLLAVAGTKTTWGSPPYKDQEISETATVVKQLEEAGAVLVAKLSMGELAMDDVWFGGLTRNPWDTAQGSSGSSAGSAAAVSAGLVPFAIGTETWGSIVSPSTRCGITGLRPTYGRVSRTGAMTLCWSMDKIGPICRNADDCALVLDVICKKDPLDPVQTGYPFVYPRKNDLSMLKVGYLKGMPACSGPNRANDSISLAILKKIGIQLVPVELPKDIPAEALSLIVDAEATAAFEDLFLAGRLGELKRQDKEYWADIFRRGHLIPAVDYIQANRFRTRLILEMDALFRRIDLLVSPSNDDIQELITNLTGHPCLTVPNGLYDGKHPGSICFIGRLYNESMLISLAKAFQDLCNFHKMHPPLFTISK